MLTSFGFGESVGAPASRSVGKGGGITTGAHLADVRRPRRVDISHCHLFGRRASKINLCPPPPAVQCRDQGICCGPRLVGQGKVPGTSAIGTTATTLMLSRLNPPDSRRRCVGVRSADGATNLVVKTGPRAAIETPSHAARSRSAPRTGGVAGPVVRRTRTGWRTERRDRPNEPTEPDRVPYGRRPDQNVADRSGSAAVAASIPRPHLAQARAQ